MKIGVLIFNIALVLSSFDISFGSDLFDDIKSARLSFFQVEDEIETEHATPESIIPLYKNAVNKLSTAILRVNRCSDLSNSTTNESGYDEMDETGHEIGFFRADLLFTFEKLSINGRVGKLINNKFGDEVSVCFAEYEQLKKLIPGNLNEMLD